MTTENLDYIHPDLRAMAVPITTLTHDPKNARRHDRRNLDAIKESLTKFGMRQPIVVQRQGDSLVVRAGNGRMTVALELGWTHLPAVVYDESDEDAVAYAIADNRTAELAEWDFKALVGLLGEGGLSADDLVGFEAHEVQNLLDANFSLGNGDTSGDGEAAGDPNNVLDDDTLNSAGVKGRTVVFSPEEWEHVIEARAKLDPDASIADTIVKLCQASA